MSWQEFIDNLFGGRYRKELEECRLKFNDCQALSRVQADEIRKLSEDIRQLKLLVPVRATPNVDYVVERDTAWVQNILDGLGLGLIRIPLDAKYYLTNQSNFLNIVAWDWIDAIKYQKERYDCENFAISFKGMVDEMFLLNSVGIVIDYGGGHAYNLVIYADGKVHIIEPQSDAIYMVMKRLKDFYPMQGAIVIL